MKTIGLCTMVAAVAWAVPALAGDPDLVAGAHWLKLACAECHTLGNVIDGKGAPVLDGVVGRKAAAMDYDYSPAMRAAAANGLVWTPENLAAFIANPRGFIPGTGMEIYGLARQADRDNLIAYLETFSPDYKAGAPSPAQ